MTVAVMCQFVYIVCFMPFDILVLIYLTVQQFTVWTQGANSWKVLFTSSSLLIYLMYCRYFLCLAIFTSILLFLWGLFFICIVNFLLLKSDTMLCFHVGSRDACLPLVPLWPARCQVLPNLPHHLCHSHWILWPILSFSLLVWLTQHSSHFCYAFHFLLFSFITML